MIVEAKDVRFFEITEIPTSEGPAVKIRGLVFHSSLAVDHLDARRSGEDVVLEVFLTPARQGLSGSFSTNVPLSSGVKRILFGPSAAQIWPAKQ